MICEFSMWQEEFDNGGVEGDLFLKQALNSLLLKDSSSQKNSKMMFKFATFRNLKLPCNTERLLYNGQD